MTRDSNNSNGFTLVEMLMVLALLGIVGAMALGVTASMVKSNNSDAALTSVMSAVHLARDHSIGERRDFLLTFTAPNQIQISRIEVPGPATTVVLKTYLDGSMTYMLFTALPDTPDAFGNAAAINFPGTPTIEFTSDGSLLNSSGDTINGSVFFGNPTDPSSARALTIFGATGLVHGWKWNGIQWVLQ
jgi:prepilin-type N-terminal cleavage/methylation domain-containing protein